jgi:hypothetical protein
MTDTMPTHTQPLGDSPITDPNHADMITRQPPKVRMAKRSDDGAAVTAYATRLAEILGGISPRQRRETMTTLATLARHGDTSAGGLQMAASLCAGLNDIAAARAVLAAVLEALDAGADVRPELRSVVHATVSAQLAQEAPQPAQDGRPRKRAGR